MSAEIIDLATRRKAAAAPVDSEYTEKIRDVVISDIADPGVEVSSSQADQATALELAALFSRALKRNE